MIVIKLSGGYVVGVDNDSGEEVEVRQYHRDFNGGEDLVEDEDGRYLTIWPEPAWPEGDHLARGVLDTVAARRDLDAEHLYGWAMEIGSTSFYEALADDNGDAAVFFEALAAGDDVDDFVYEPVGRAVDRIEDAFDTHEQA